MTEKIELMKGSGNVFRDFGYPTADVEQLKGILAAKIIGVLDDCKLSVRKAKGLTGVQASEFSRIRNAQLARFTIDRLMTILNRLNCRVEVKVTIKPGPASSARTEHGAQSMRVSTRTGICRVVFC
jgi:predicted XRE-type DNA-binding protein